MKLLYFNYENIPNSNFRRPEGTKGLIKNGQPYSYPRTKAIFFTILLLISLVLAIIRISRFELKNKIIILICLILVIDIFASFIHFLSDIKKTNTFSRRYDFKKKHDKEINKKVKNANSSDKTTTLHHIDVLDHLDMTTYELITWAYHVGGDKLILICFLFAISPVPILNQIANLLAIIILFGIHFEYFHGAIHVHHNKRGKVPFILGKLMDFGLMASPEYHAKHHTRSDQNWSVFIGLFDKPIEMIAKYFNLIKKVEYLKPTKINPEFDNRMRVPEIWEFWWNFSKDVVYKRSYSAKTGWAYSGKK